MENEDICLEATEKLGYPGSASCSELSERNFIKPGPLILNAG